MKMSRREQIDLLRRVSKRDIEGSALRILAAQIEKELEAHNQISRQSRKDQPKIIGRFNFPRAD